MSVTAHYITADWTLKHEILDVVHLPGSHSGKNLAAAFLETLDKYSMRERFLCLTLDNASSNDVMMSELMAEIPGCNPESQSR